MYSSNLKSEADAHYKEYHPTSKFSSVEEPTYYILQILHVSKDVYDSPDRTLNLPQIWQYITKSKIKIQFISFKLVKIL